MAFTEQAGIAVAPARALGRRPIVLAQLPRIGTAPTPKSTQLPSSDDRAELVTSSDGRTTYFIDGRHTQPTPEAIQPPTHETRERRSAQSQSGVPTATLFRLHSQVAPYAGLIVAMALIACAGLLYWIISGPSAAPLDYRDIYNIGQDGFRASSLNFADPEMPAPTPTATESAVAAELDATEPFISEPIMVEMPTADESAPELAFPQTATPSALNFSLLRDDYTLPGSVPEVAQRTVPQPMTPTISR